MWFGSLIHGLVIENISMNIPDIENYWQSQTTIVFLGRKMPLHIMLLCECAHVWYDWFICIILIKFMTLVRCRDISISQPIDSNLPIILMARFHRYLADVCPLNLQSRNG